MNNALYNQIRIFQSIAREGNISAAARKHRILPLLLNDRGEQLTVEMPGQLISNDIDVMADGIRNGLGIGRLFEPVWQLQPDRERFIPVMERYWKTYPPVYLYYPKNAGKTKRVKALIDFLISTTGR